MSNEAKEIDAKLRAKYPEIFSEKKLDKSNKNESVQAKCRDCQQNYEKTIFYIMGVKMDLTGGRCPKCRDIYLANAITKSEILKQKAIKQQRHDWWLSSGVVDEYLYKSFETYKKEKQLKSFQVCLDYANKYPLEKTLKYYSLILFSTPSVGTGKTHLASAICRRILERWNGEGAEWDDIEYTLTCKRRNPVYFVTEPDLFGSIRATFNYTDLERNTRLTEEQIMNKLITVPLLVIDDIGKEEVSDRKFVQRTMFKIIDARYRKGLPMVVTANLDKQGLAKHLSGETGNEASWSRLLSMSKGRMFQMEGEDYRQMDWKTK